ncbi:MAG: hypothetical protein SFY95_03220 [Planctomycetota bacterium]|nr:hypothetical protein [Planctomycetota bacterium]
MNRMRSSSMHSWSRSCTSRLLGSLSGVTLAAAMLLATAGAATPVLAQASGQGGSQAAKTPERAKLIFKDGTVREGEILTETDTTIRFKGSINGLPFEVEYKKADLLKIERLASTPADAAPAVPAVPVATAAKAEPTASPASSGDKKKVYWIELKGEFGVDIAETPLRQAVRDAQNNKADVLLLSLENDWSEGIQDLPSDPELGEFDELFRAEKFAPILSTELIENFDTPPKVVFWVKQAMGGAAFLPMVAPTIYFAPEGRMGGIGNLSTMFGSIGDEVVRQKQYSLRMAHAEGMAILGGHDYRIMRAMARIEYVLSVRFEGGRPVLLERKPQGPDEILLTWEGVDPNKDSIRDRATGEGKDVLTLNAKLAQDLGVSQGTAESIDDLLYKMDLSRSGEVIRGNSQGIFQQWRRGLDSAKRTIRENLRKFAETQVQGDFTERTKARGTQQRMLQEILDLLNRYGESISGRWRGQNGVPPPQQLRLRIETLKIEQLLDGPGGGGGGGGGGVGGGGRGPRG